MKTIIEADRYGETKIDLTMSNDNFESSAYVELTITETVSPEDGKEEVKELSCTITIDELYAMLMGFMTQHKREQEQEEMLERRESLRNQK